MQISYRNTYLLETYEFAVFDSDPDLTFCKESNKTTVPRASGFTITRWAELSVGRLIGAIHRLMITQNAASGAQVTFAPGFALNACLRRRFATDWSLETGIGGDSARTVAYTVNRAIWNRLE
jgi:hypothetical protein